MGLILPCAYRETSPLCLVHFIKKMGPILNSRNVGKVCEYNVIFLHVCFLRIHVDHNIALGRLLINPCYIIYIGDVKFVVGNSNYD